MGIPLLDQGVANTMQLEMSGGVKPHYKLGKANSNFILKFLFNSLAKK
jgi:hypothetical protein